MLNSRPKTSPYLSRLIKIRIGDSSDEYMIHEDCIRAYYKLSRHLDAISASDLLDLEEADSRVGHTFIHYLYSKNYEILVNGISTAGDMQEKEFEHGILVYSAAVKYDISGLVQLAKDEVCKAAASLTLSSAIKHARNVFDSLPRGDEWFLGFMKSLMEESMEKNADTFLSKNFFSGFGKHKAFDPYLCRSIVEIYQKRLSRLSEETQKRFGASKEECIPENSDFEETAGLAPDPTTVNDVPVTEYLETEQPEDFSLTVEGELDSPADPTAVNNIPATEYLETEEQEEAPLMVEDETKSLPVEDDSLAEPPEEGEPLPEYLPQEERTAEPEILISNTVEEDSELNQKVREPDIWGSLGRFSKKEKRKGKKAKKGSDVFARSSHLENSVTEI